MSQSPSQPPLCEEEVYAGIYRQQSEKLRNSLYYKCGDLDQAEDLVQEAFLRLWRKCAEVLREKAVGFLYTVANNLFLDQVRSQKVALKFEKAQDQENDTHDPHFQLRTQEFKAQLEAAISSLPPAQREAFLLNRIDKLTYKEIAERLEISDSAVERRIAKALVNLKAKLDELKNFKL